MLQSMGLQRVGQDWATEQQQQKDISRNLALFYVWEDARGSALWNHSFHMHFSYLGLVSCVFHILLLQFLSAHHKEWLQPNGCQIAGTVLLLGLTPGSKIHTGRAGITDDYDILIYWYSFVRVREGPQSCPTLCDPMYCSLPGSFLHPWDSPGKHTAVGCQFLLQEIFPTQGSNLGLPHCRQTLYHLSHQGYSRKYSISQLSSYLYTCLWFLSLCGSKSNLPLLQVFKGLKDIHFYCIPVQYIKIKCNFNINCNLEITPIIKCTIVSISYSSH